MRIVVFGSTGDTGRAVVEQARERGHLVTAFARPGRSPSPPGIRVVHGDVGDPARVQEAVRGQDAVVSALGPRRAEDPSTLTAGLRHIVTAMSELRVRRLVGMSGAGVVLPGDQRSPGAAAVAFGLGRLVLRRDVAAKQAQHAVLAGTGLDWTLVRPPRMVSGPLTGRYEHGGFRLTMRHLTVSFADVAQFLLDEVEHPRHLRAAPFISSPARRPRQR